MFCAQGSGVQVEPRQLIRLGETMHLPRKKRIKVALPLDAINAAASETASALNHCSIS